MKYIFLALFVLFIVSCKDNKIKPQTPPITLKIDTALYEKDSSVTQKNIVLTIWLGKTEKTHNTILVEQQIGVTDSIVLSDVMYNAQYILNDYNEDGYLDIELPTRQFRPSKYFIYNPIKHVFLDNDRWMSFWGKLGVNLYYNYLDDELKDCADVYSTMFTFKDYQITTLAMIEVESIPQDSCESGLTVKKALLKKFDANLDKPVWTKVLDRSTIDSFSDKESSLFRHKDFFNYVWKTHQAAILNK